ncbi:MAG: hypothetical protein PHQ52_07370 [Candidatus Omnitrophica bacterium]|nr:hypothetical protein [Candidatus Omnitrophota bacterium]
MKKYVPPKIKNIELKPSQAVLQVCVVGGIYFFAGNTVCMSGAKSPITFVCTIPNKGNSKGTAWDTATSSIPS